MAEQEKVHHNINYLKKEAQNLALRQKITLGASPLKKLGPLLQESHDILNDAYRELVRAVKQKRELSTAAEWFVDNYYIIQEQFVEVEEDLPPSYYKKLPRLLKGEYRGLPRIYELIQLLATVNDNVIDKENTIDAVQAFQEEEALKIGELWAIPIMIRLVLLLRLTDKIEELKKFRLMRRKIDELLDEIQQHENREPGFLLRQLSDMAYEQPSDERYLCLLAQRLQARGMLTDSERQWFDYKFSQWNTTLEGEMRQEAQRTSQLHLSIQNAISTLREVTESDWSDFVETCSIVDRILRLDPSGYYPNMAFETRDRYRKVIERLSANSSKTEIEIAEQALLLTEETSENGYQNSKKRHIGYYLISDGYALLTQSINYSMPWGEWIRKKIDKNSVFYIGFITVFLFVLLGIVTYLSEMASEPPWLIGISLAVAFFPALELSIVSVNRILSMFLNPRIMPKLEINGDIRDEFRTLIVVPTLFTSVRSVREQFEALEIRALANPNKNLQFALLSDFTDADKETMPDDDGILRAAKEEVQKLNREYSSNYGDKFYLLHRKREWNEKQKKWMGWERKRGKLEELNSLLRNKSAKTTFTTISGDFIESIQKAKVQYVLTLDADTKLPPGSALKLISTAAHPLNRAEIDEERHIVRNGYGLFQPRISIPPKAANRTYFTKVFSGHVGIDPYTTAVSDIYQDLFAEGIYTGKGLYDVDVFNEVLGERFPDNLILSHDLLESNHLRTALLTDIELFDDYPSTYLNYIKRSHRWIRGDWQILHWLLRKVPANNGGKVRNQTSFISRWKIFDNLRRSLNPVFLLIFLLVGWFLLPGSPLLWTAAALGVVAFPIYSSFTTEIFKRPPRVKWKLYLRKIHSDGWMNTVQTVSTFIFMPHMAYVALDAICRTLWRMFVSKENLLQWTSASVAEKESDLTFWQYWRRMWINVAWPAIGCFLVWFFDPIVLAIASPILISWLVAPAVAYKLGKIKKERDKGIDSEDEQELQNYLRRTWHYFEMYVNEKQSWLPPDNFQEEPYVGVIERTSPTNIGLGLVATLVAYDFGYLPAGEFLKRIGNMLGSIKLLEKFNGHLFNWYGTVRGEPLSPRYISTVDSGNMAASLIVVKQALNQLGESEWPNKEFKAGLGQTIDVIKSLVKKDLAKLDTGSGDGDTLDSFMKQLDQFDEQLSDFSPKDLHEWLMGLKDLHSSAEKLSEIDLRIVRKKMSKVKYEVLEDWFERPRIQIEAMRDEILVVVDQMNIVPGEEGLAGKKIRELGKTSLFADWLQRAGELAEWCDTMVKEMNFSMLYNKDHNLFSIGYNLDHASLDNSTYDQLATEARLASYIAIAKGDVPPKHWFHLSRRLTSIENNEILLSWSGTMFEYLMPVLFMPDTESTLLSKTYEYVVQWQKDYGESQHRPWGFSESGYGMLNLELHYQYRAFGAPGLGLRRGLADDYVAAPYATMLALMISPKNSLENLRNLKQEGAFGLNGFYEAVDYTSSKEINREEKTVVRMYMAHHQGMSLLALANVLKGNMVQRLFDKDPLIQACEVLLQEKIPRGIPIKEPRPIDVEMEPSEEDTVQTFVEHVDQPRLEETPARTHILSNGNYMTVINHAGSGFSACEDLQLTRWRADQVQDSYGLFFYIKDLESNEFWSVGHQPVGRKADRYDSWFHTGKMQMARVDEWIESFMEVCVSPEDNIELRKLTFTNYSQQTRRLELTSYAEVVLNEAETDKAHRAFSNLFVQTDYITEHHTLLAKRRPREEGEQPHWLVHSMVSDDMEKMTDSVQFETDRGNFVGRGRDLKYPAAMDENAELSDSIGNVPDPVFSMRRTIELEPGEKKSITFTLGKADSREKAISLADNYDNPYATDRVFELASIYGRVELDHIGLSGRRAHYFQKMAGIIIYQSEQLRASEDTIMQNQRTQSGLWSFGISGDVPIVFFNMRDTDHLETLEQLLKAHAFWRLKGLQVDLVVINDHPVSYIDELQEAIHSHIQSSMERQKFNQKGGIFVIRSDETSREDLILLKTVASVIIDGELPDLSSSDRRSLQAEKLEVPYQPVDLSKVNNLSFETPDLQFFNGYGGFARKGKEYVIHLESKDGSSTLEYPPAPWINVLANPDFGCITSESGSDYAWSQNSRENRLTPWSNDAVIDPPGEVIYLRDQDSGLFWTPTPAPVPGSNHYEIRHGFGYSRYHSNVMDLVQTVTKWVDPDDPVKVVKLQLSNTGLTPRKISAFRYLDWVLGVYREENSRHVITHYDSTLQTIFARNFYNNEFAGRMAFASLFTENPLDYTGVTSDRKSFIGRNKDLSNPEAVSANAELNNRFGAGFDSCAAFQTDFKIESGDSLDIYFLLGEAAAEDQARDLIRKYRDKEMLESSLTETKTFWKNKLGKIQVHTPVAELNIMMNGWLQYQNIACRIWARSGFYQSGGAFGFRDQLQDVSAALYLDREMTRDQILLHAAHQFPEGDVLHWWHPPTDRGTRTRITDDLLWLPYVTALYIKRTGDDSILNEEVSFISARLLNEDEQEAYLKPDRSDQTASLYEHCCRAIDHSLTTGNHGLPLMGAGDWNDGMNRVGREGQGESVWLGFFLYKILTDFMPLCEQNGDTERLKKYQSYQNELKNHLNNEGWDGEWYRRAFYDDGTPLGSAKGDECKIDSIAQSWSVISGAAPPEKSKQALNAAYNQLISERDGIIRLLAPPFDQTPHNPGYIKGYLPGVRENGGQYTHAALWLVRAFAEIGSSDRAVDLMRMLTPVNHSYPKEKADRYRVEPYAVVADIYAEYPLIGMGGWTWYTGSAGWMYRVILESILGLQVTEGKKVTLDPSIPSSWNGFSIRIKAEDAEEWNKITVQNTRQLEAGKLSVQIDGTVKNIAVDDPIFTLNSHESSQHIQVRVGISEK